MDIEQPLQEESGFVYSTEKIRLVGLNTQVTQYRLLTTARTILGVLLGTLFVYFHVPFLHIFVTILIPVVVGISVSVVHHASSGVASVEQLIFTSGLGLVAVSIYTSFPTTNEYVLQVLVFPVILIISLIQSFIDPGFTAGIITKFAALFLITAAIQPTTPPSSTEYHFVVQFLIAIFIAVAITLVSYVIFATSALKILTKDLAVVLRNVDLQYGYLATSMGISQHYEDQELTLLTEHELLELENNEVNFSSDTKILKDTSDFQKKLGKQFEFVTGMMGQVKRELWLPEPLVSNAEDIYAITTELVAHLENMVNALQEGFHPRLTLRLVHPILKQVSKLKERMHTMLQLIISKLETAYSARETETELPVYGENGYDLQEEPILKMNRKMKSVANHMLSGYAEIIEDMMRNGHLNILTKTGELARMNFFIWQMTEFRRKLRRLSVSVLAFDKKEKIRPTSWWRTRLGVLFQPFANMLSNVVRFSNATKLVLQHGQLPFTLEDVKNYFKLGYWKYPVAFSFIVGSSMVLSYTATVQLNQDIKSFWAPISAAFILMPTLGATLKRAIHRAVGTVFGALAGFLVLLAVDAVGNQFLSLPFIIVFTAIITYFQHSTRQSRPYGWTVAQLTFLLILFYQLPGMSVTWSLFYLRLIHVVIGSVYAIVVFALFWARATSTLEENYISLLNEFQEIITVSTAQIYKFVPIKQEVEEEAGLHMEDDEEANDYLLSATPRVSDDIIPVYWPTKLLEAVGDDMTGFLSAHKKSIGASYLAHKALLKEAKAELFFFRRKRQRMIDMSEFLKQVSPLLIEMMVISGTDLPEYVLEPLTAYRRELANTLLPVIEKYLGVLRVGLGDEEASDRAKMETPELVEAIQMIDDEYLRFRRAAVQDGKLASYHPSLVRSQAFLHSIRQVCYLLLELVDESSIKEV